MLALPAAKFAPIVVIKLNSGKSSFKIFATKGLILSCNITTLSLIQILCQKN